MRIITCRRLRRDRRGISGVIVVALSLVIIVAIASDIVLWNYQMNQLDWEKMKESVAIVEVQRLSEGSQFTFENTGGLTVHLVSLWVINSTLHQRYDVNLFINSGETKTYVRGDILLPDGNYVVKSVTERGNIAVYSGS